MRVLVEQTHRIAIDWLYRLDLFTDEAKEQHPEWSRPIGDLGQHPIAVHLLLGGEEKTDWALWPERDAVLIGTQDMLLSRAMNRGYAAGRARWPQEFGLLNSDCLWVFDEIQLMDTSLATSLQLDAWRRSLPLRPSRDALPKENAQHLARGCRSLWMSATMAKHWLERAVDWSEHVDGAWQSRRQLSTTERADCTLRSGQIFEICKQLSQAPLSMLVKPKTKDNRADKADADRNQFVYLNQLAEHIINPGHHAESGLTLIIVNTVDRATKLYELLHDQLKREGIPIRLIHSRFRPHEREQWADFLNQKNAGRRILISTQVIEAGVDLSAKVLYTELAPWAALVQRFGRCARYPGETGHVIWLDFDLGTDKSPVEHWARPYTRDELVAARKRLRTLPDVGLKSLNEIKQQLDTDGEQASRLFPYEPRFVPRAKDLFDLFDTTPDLTGADVDVSRFIRDGDELDVLIFWREVPADLEPTKKHRPQRRELCPVAFHRFQDFARDALKQRHRIWRRRYSNGRDPTSMWELLELDSVDQAIYPGQIFLLDKSCGGYSTERGWTGDPKNAVEPVPEEDTGNKVESSADTEDSEDLSELSRWFSIEEHCRDVGGKMAALLEDSEVSVSEKKVLLIAARLHDWGKVHEAFQAKLKPDLLSAATSSDLKGQPAAKAPDGKDRQTGKRDETKNAWRRDKIKMCSQASDIPESEKDKRRPGHRHELASALAILETLCSAQPAHEAFSWPEGLDKLSFGEALKNPGPRIPSGHPLAQELAALSADELDLLVYLVASHHGKVRMSLRSSPDDGRDDVPDRCPADRRQARGVCDGDVLASCRLPAPDLAAAIDAPEVILSLDPMELGLSQRYGASWRERAQLLLERLGPFRLGYLEALLRAADCRASKEEDECGRGSP